MTTPAVTAAFIKLWVMSRISLSKAILSRTAGLLLERLSRRTGS
jgi:hypothetical protein